MKIDKKKLVKLAQSGELDEMMGLIDKNIKNPMSRDIVAYQWLQVAEGFGHKDAGNQAEDLFEASLSRFGDETMGDAHFEIGRWYLLGEHGILKDEKKALGQFKRSQEFGGPDVHIQEIEKLQLKLKGSIRDKFKKIFLEESDGKADE
jgi:hypothetical protein